MCDVAIDRAGYQSLQVCFVLFTGQVSPSGINGTLHLSLMLKKTTAKTETLLSIFLLFALNFGLY